MENEQNVKNQKDGTNKVPKKAKNKIAEKKEKIEINTIYDCFDLVKERLKKREKEGKLKKDKEIENANGERYVIYDASSVINEVNNALTKEGIVVVVKNIVPANNPFMPNGDIIMVMALIFYHKDSKNYFETVISGTGNNEGSCTTKALKNFYLKHFMIGADSEKVEGQVVDNTRETLREALRNIKKQNNDIYLKISRKIKQELGEIQPDSNMSDKEKNSIFKIILEELSNTKPNEQ